MKLKCWKKVRNTNFGGNISQIWIKGKRSLELFRDSYWGGRSMNVIIRDGTKKSLESSLGRTSKVEYFDNSLEAERFANKYMKKHDKC